MNCVEKSKCKNFVEKLRNNNIQFFRSLLLSACDISQIVNDLPNGMAAGNDNLTAENLKYVSLNLFIILALFNTSMLLHATLPYWRSYCSYY